MITAFNLTWVPEQPEGGYPTASASAGATAGVRPRRAHTKSRQGCLICKRRRKKCDEARPTCGQCQHHQVCCEYATGPADAGHVVKLSSKRSQYTMSRQSTRNEILRLLEITQKTTTFPDGSQFEPVDELQLIDHFINDKSQWIGAPECQNILQQSGVRLGLEAPHLLHAILAFSASHIDYLRPDKRYRIAAVRHNSLLLSLYTPQMRHLSTENVTPLFGTCTLLNMLSYLGVAYDNPEPCHDPEYHECDWDAFRSLQGLGILQSVPELRNQLSHSIWSPAMTDAELFEKSNENGHVEHVEHQTTSQWTSAMEEMRRISKVSLDFSDTDNVYADPLRRLNNLIYRDINETNIGQVMHFISNVSPAFIDIGQQFDPRALLLIAYWHALLLKTGQWWIVQTAIGACSRLCVYLWRSGGSDMRPLLQLPALYCGIDLEAIE